MERVDKYDMFTTMSVPRLICKQAGPTILSMLVTALYNMADTFYVGRINTQATAAVGVAFSLMAIIQALGFFMGHGSGNFISRSLGARDIGAAKNMATTGFISGMILGTIIMIVGLIFLEPLCVGLGSTPTILPYTKKYIGIILLGAPFMTSSLVLNNQMRFQGNAAYSMIGIVSGAVLNIALAPLCIFTFGWGIAGAAIATVFCQIFSFTLLFIMDHKGSNISIKFRYFKPSLSIYKEIVKGGSPSLCRQGLACIATLMLNVAAGSYGDAAIAGMSIVTRFTFFIFAFVIGFGQGFQPVCGFNYGAKLYGRVLKGFWFCVKVSTIFLLVCSIVCFIFAPQIVEIFRHDPDVVAVGTPALRWLMAVFPLAAFVTTSNMMLQTICKSARAVILASSRQGLFFIPLILILPSFFGLKGVEMCQAISDMLAFLIAIPLTWGVIRDLGAGK
jgi:putative MATE family efflux protein